MVVVIIVIIIYISFLFVFNGSFVSQDAEVFWRRLLPNEEADLHLFAAAWREVNIEGVCMCECV
jgi:hypothetical protein